MKYTIKEVKNSETKTISFKFKSKKEEEKYISICLDIWGCVPVEIDWATNTNVYKSKINE